MPRSKRLWVKVTGPLRRKTSRSDGHATLREIIAYSRSRDWQPLPFSVYVWMFLGHGSRGARLLFSIGLFAIVMPGVEAARRLSAAPFKWNLIIVGLFGATYILAFYLFVFSGKFMRGYLRIASPAVGKNAIGEGVLALLRGWFSPHDMDGIFQPIVWHGRGSDKFVRRLMMYGTLLFTALWWGLYCISEKMRR